MKTPCLAKVCKKTFFDVRLTVIILEVNVVLFLAVFNDFLYVIAQSNSPGMSLDLELINTRVRMAAHGMLSQY